MDAEDVDLCRNKMNPYPPRSSPLPTDAREVVVVDDPFPAEGSAPVLNGQFRRQSPAVSVVQPARAFFPLPPLARVAPPQQRAAPGPLPAPPVRTLPPTAAIPATTTIPVKQLHELFIGNVPLHPHSDFKIEDDKIAAAFHKSSRKTLNFIPPSVQNGEVIVRPSIDIIRAGSQRWNTTAVGYFLVGTGHGVKKTETHRSPGLDQTSTLAGGTLDDRGFEHGGEWNWPTTVPDAITRACTRLDFARVCVMLNVSSKLPKHVVIMMPNELGGESACKVDVEYEWLPPKCMGCSSLGHSTKECPLSKPTKPAVSIYVRKSMPIIPAEPELKLKKKVQADPVPKEIHPEPEVDRVSEDMPGYDRDKAIWNVRGLNRRDHQVAVRDLVNEFRLHFIALLETRVLQNNVTRIQSGLLSRWRWFVDYGGPGNRIWIAWNDELIDVDILNVDSQFVHCRVHIYELHETILITVVYGANDVSARRELWQGLIDLSVTIGNELWLVGGDFNAVLDLSEVSGASGTYEWP
ncbi:hypothetical protein Sango_2949100 [Sesamum angolense]|uniref:Endonuclease/exonuclease/phosphatase domain-containing protein n=1 Tax=Sesamum angolense TaxID=2727404 RepID=A0AAE1T514_9LAMI|nr:hypothetical protein Sango_2949100 [Sesamum angolense]